MERGLLARTISYAFPSLRSRRVFRIDRVRSAGLHWINGFHSSPFAAIDRLTADISNGNRWQTATSSVEATGAAPLSYQWQRNRTAISGATSSSYTTAATTSSDNGAQFTVMVNNPAGASPATPLRSQSLRQCQASVSHQPPYFRKSSSVDA